MTNHRDQLAAIRSFPSLVKYLRDEMGWPIGADSFEDLTFDYAPEELGIDPKNAAKIEEIKRLRPLASGQPWGIFFVKFEPKRLPVVALRRILSQVVLKKRATAKAAELAAWAADDLLFISNYGEGDARHISFAHFSMAEGGTDLPTLKVLGWDNLDTPLHLGDVAERLKRDLSWPGDEDDAKAWRQAWRGAFALQHREVVTTSQALSVRLAELARAIRDRIGAALAIETESGPLTRLMKAFQGTLVHDLDRAGFADMYAQTIAYGLLSSRIANPKSRTADDFAAHMRTNPLLRELMQTFLQAGGRRGRTGGPEIDFDELGVSEVVGLLDRANMEAVLRDFGDRNPLEDPVIHFYELFLKEYDPQKRMQRGVFYTPRPVVSYIVRSVDELLRTEFGLPDGLADTTSWGEMAKRHADLRIPEGVSAEQDFVQILDPATGTGTFLVEVIDLIHKTLVAKWNAQRNNEKKIDALWTDYVPRHLLTRLHGYELLMAPYAIAHLKIGLKLYETGYRFDSDERARIYLTNALEAASDAGQQKLVGILPALAHETQAVNTTKRSGRFTVVVGNPPYSTSISEPPWLMRLLDDWKQGLNETKSDLNREEWKFLRLLQHHSVVTGALVVGVIINRDFLDGIVKRRMREMLSECFPYRMVVDLNGDVKGNIVDDNVFDIEQGVTIVVMSTQTKVSKLLYTSLVGSRDSKYNKLLNSCSIRSESAPVYMEPPYFRWMPYLSSHSAGSAAEYMKWPQIRDIFGVVSSGIQTKRDGLCVAFTRSEIWDRIQKFNSMTAQVAKQHFDLADDGRDWKIASAKLDISNSGPNKKLISKILYRPFDIRFTYWTGKTKGFLAYPRREVMQHVIGQQNIGIIFNRQIVGDSVSHFGVSRIPICHGTFYLGNKGQDYFAPALIFDDSLMGQAGSGRSNFLPSFTTAFRKSIGAKPAQATDGQIFGYIYAAVHSPGYRARYAEFLKMDFPRLPAPRDLDFFRAMAKLGNHLVSLHLMEAAELDNSIASYFGPRSPEVGRVGWSGDTVWIDCPAQRAGQVQAQGSMGFRGVNEAVWNFHVGGYQVCEKWLKDRKGRTLAAEDIAHYQKIIVALSETIRIMGEIDAVIEKHGGWPGAFAPTDAEAQK